MKTLRATFMKPDATVRIAADFLIVHISMVAALAAAVVYHTALGEQVVANRLVAQLASYYLYLFWPLSLLFPAVFYLAGFYTRGRTYRGRHKLMLLLQGSAMAILLFVSANFMFFREELVPRSVAVVFCALLMSGTILARSTNELMRMMDAREDGTVRHRSGEG